jgi:hypothetical protein
MGGDIVSMPNSTQAVVEKSNLDQIRTAPGSYHIGNFDGKERYIRFDLNAFAEMETKFGNMEEAQERLKGGSMKDIRTVLWLGLIWDEVVLDDVTGEPIRYTLSEYQVGSWLTTLNLEEVMSKLQDAISGSLPDNPENKPSGEVMTETVQAAPNTESVGTLPN